jgi:penicillin-insensitive murein endopeptidase
LPTSRVAAKLGAMRIGLVVAAVVLGGAGATHATPFPAAWLPRHGEGYLIPDTWAARGLRYGRPELIELVGRVAGRVADELPGATLYVGDLSLKTGAWTQWHRSHRNGCDVDLMFYAIDDEGRPLGPPEEMIPFDDGGVARLADGSIARFDVARNWALVRALVEDEAAEVVRIFVSEGLRAQLLSYAVGVDAPARIVARAAAVLGQPSDSAAHDDHFHVRIAGPPLIAKASPAKKKVAAKARAGKVVKAGKGRAVKVQKALVRHRRR